MVGPKSFHVASLLALLITSPNLLAQEDPMSSALKNFKTGRYNGCVEELAKIQSGTKAFLGTRYYLEGLCHNKIQQFDDAVIAFERAIRLGNQTEDIYYELGQALYAANELEKSSKSFEKSYLTKYKIGSSLYYMAHIHQLLEDHRQAKKIFERILNEEKEDKSILQAARFQMAESMIAMLEERDSDKKRIVSDYILPQYQQAADELPTSSAFADITKRIQEIKRQYGLDPNIMKNGRTLPEKRWSVGFSQEIKYDNNITLATDLPTVQATQKDSYIYDTQLTAKYTANFFGRIITAPDIRIKSTTHADRETSEVYKNDSYNITPALKNSFEHTLFGERASFLFEIDYSYIGRDTLANKEKNFYSRATTYTFGEKFKFFSKGDTTLKIKSKDYYGYLPSLDNKTFSLSADQVLSLSGGHLAILLFSYDDVDVYNSPRSSTRSYLFRTDYIIPNAFAGWMLNLAMSVTMLDTLIQKPTRGVEKTYTPSVKITKNAIWRIARMGIQ
jgi:tetratricopeptide (TPR) repeat protein